MRKQAKGIPQSFSLEAVPSWDADDLFWEDKAGPTQPGHVRTRLEENSARTGRILEIT